MSITDYSRQFLKKGLPVEIKTIDKRPFQLLPQFREGEGMSVFAADKFIKELKSQNIEAKRVQWKETWLVYAALEPKLTRKKEKLPPNFKTINGQRYVIVDPMSFKKTHREYLEAARYYKLAFRQQVVKFEYKDGYVVYRSVAPLLTPKKKAVKAKPKKKEVKPVKEKLKIPIRKKRTQAWFNALTPTMKKLFVGKMYTLKDEK